MKRVLAKACVACLATALLAAEDVGAATPLVEIRVSPDVTVTLATTVVDDERIAGDNLDGTINLVNIGTIPPQADLDAYHFLPNGDQLLSFDTSVTLPGGLTARHGDVVRFSGGSYSIDFDAAARGVPGGVNLDAVAMQGSSLLLSFDVTVELGGLVADDEDLVLFDGAIFSLFFDGSAAGVDPGLDLDALDAIECNDHLLLSFDGSGVIGGVAFDDDDVLEYDRAASWEKVYDGETVHSEWRGADLDAIQATVDLGPPVVFGQTLRASSNKVDFLWPNLAPFKAVRGSFASPGDIGHYVVNLTTSGTGTVLSDPSMPAMGTGSWYLVTRGGCVQGSWQSILGAEPGRDAALP